jgi:hypothetical protein
MRTSRVNRILKSLLPGVATAILGAARIPIGRLDPVQMPQEEIDPAINSSFIVHSD